MIRNQDQLFMRTLLALLATAGVSLVGCSEPESPTEEIRQLERQRNIEALTERVKNEKPEVSRRAVRSLGRIGAPAAPALRQALSDPRPRVREEAVFAYPKAARRDEAGKPLADVVRNDPSAMVRASAATALGDIRAVDEIQALFDALDDPDPTVRRRAAAAVARITGRDYELYVDGPPEKRRQAIAALRATWPQMKGTVLRYYESLRNTGRK